MSDQKFQHNIPKTLRNLAAQSLYLKFDVETLLYDHTTSFWHNIHR